MNIVSELANDPMNFFKKPRDLRKGFLYTLLSMFVFVFLNQAMLELGFAQFSIEMGFFTGVIVNYTTLAAGYLAITSLCAVPFRIVGGKKARDLFVVITYSIIPLAFFWIPHILAQAVVMFLVLTLITSGVSIKANTSKKNALLVTFFFLALVLVFSMGTMSFFSGAF